MQAIALVLSQAARLMVTSLSEAFAGLLPQETNDTAAAPSKQPSSLNAGAAEWRPPQAAASVALGAGQRSAQYGPPDCNTDAPAAKGDWSAATYQQVCSAAALVDQVHEAFPTSSRIVWCDSSIGCIDL